MLGQQGFAVFEWLEVGPNQVNRNFFWSIDEGLIYEEAESLGKIMFATEQVIVGSVQNNVLQKLKETLELRREYLNKAGMEEDKILETDKERRDFLQFAKKKFHEQPEQVEKQRKDIEAAMGRPDATRFLHNRKHSRWGCEMQRRCGCKGLWEVVSFTGQVNYRVLRRCRGQPSLL